MKYLLLWYVKHNYFIRISSHFFLKEGVTKTMCMQFLMVLHLEESIVCNFELQCTVVCHSVKKVAVVGSQNVEICAKYSVFADILFKRNLQLNHTKLLLRLMVRMLC